MDDGTASNSSISNGDSGSNPDDANSATQDSSGLSAGAKAGIGVGAALGVIAIIVAIFFLYKRRRKSEPKATPKFEDFSRRIDDNGFQQKAELRGSYSPTIAGPVVRKAELDELEKPASRVTELGLEPSLLSRSQELSTTTGPVGRKAEVDQEDNPVRRAAELGLEPSLFARSHELGNSRRLNAYEIESDPPTVASTGTSRRPPQTTSTPSSFEPLPSNSDGMSKVAEEVDILVSELGIVAKRKRFVGTTVEARQSEEYRTLEAREQELRSRLSELQSGQ
jgi:hypothetical protein